MGLARARAGSEGVRAGDGTHGQTGRASRRHNAQPPIARRLDVQVTLVDGRRGYFTYWDRASLTRLFREEGLRLEHLESFGLGRDFVQRFGRLARRVRPLSPAGQETRPTNPRRWDATGPVVLLEDLLNAGLGLSGTGVGVGGLWLKPPAGSP